MSSRYQELYRLPNKLYVENSPVLIEAGALQKDTVSDKVLAQIKIRNLSTKDIIACKVAIKAYETNGNEVEGVSEFSYLDINISKGKEFGTKTPIYLPNNATRKFSVVVKEVVFEDNSIWTSNLIEWTQIVAQKKITELFNNLEDIKQYQIEVGENCEFYPEKREGLFFCTCGATNLDTAAQCYHCGKKYDLLISCLNEELLTRKRNERLEKEKLEKEEANRLAEIEQKRKEEKRKKIIKVSKIFILTMIFITIVFTLIFIQPYILRYKINDTIEKKDYLISLDYIEKVKDEQESLDLYERVTLCMYEDVLKSIEEKDYVLGAELSKKYQNYINFEECIKLVQKICPHENVNEESMEASCEIDGYNIKQCELCEYVEKTNYKAYGHDYIENIDKEPTCDANGNKHLTCQSCGFEKDVVITKLGHNYEKKESIKPTCDKAGEYLYTCSRCSDKYTENIKAKGHSFKSATCTEDGSCSTCGAKGESALGHNWSGYKVACSRCSISYPANINFVGMPSSGQITGVTINAVNVVACQVYDYTTSKLAQMQISVSGTKSGSSSSVTVEFYNSSGSCVTSKSFYIGSENNFTSVSEFVNLQTDQTYTVKVSY